jgi:hypothetical protein
VIRLLAATIVLLGIAVGCGGHEPGADPPRTKVFELANYPLERLGYIGIGSSLREIDPDTLQPRTRRGLRLGGYFDQFVLSPDRGEAAFGINFGELVFVDLAELHVRDRLKLGDVDWLVRPIGWPRPDLLYALGCHDQGKYGCPDTRLLLIDPTTPRQLAAIDLGGSAEGTYDRARRTSVILVTPHRVSPARLLIAEPTGVVHGIELTRILVGETKRRLLPHSRLAAFFVEGGRAIVIGSRGLVAEVSLRSHRVRYHRVADLAVDDETLARAPARRWMGTVNPMSSERVYLRKAWPGTALVWSSASRLGNGGETVREATVRRLLDIRDWSTRRPFPYRSAEPAGVVLIAARSAEPYRGPMTLLAYERSGAVRYRLRFPRPVTYSTYGNRLYVGRIDGRKTSVYDARTGNLLHRMPPTEVEPAFTWIPPS